MILKSVLSIWAFFLLLGLQQVTSTSKALSSGQVDHENLREGGLTDKFRICQDNAQSKTIEILRKTNEDLLKLVSQLIQKQIDMAQIDELKAKIAEVKLKATNDIKEIRSQVTFYENQLQEHRKQLSLKNCLAESNSMKLPQRDLLEPKSSCVGLSPGIHLITIPQMDPFSALCIRGEWMVIQKRFDGIENFYRNWTDFQHGFGDFEGDFFIGLEKLHRLTNSETFNLRIEITFFNGPKGHAFYDNFRIGNEDNEYELESLGEFRGTNGNEMKKKLNGKFSNYDRDNDLLLDANCAKMWSGASWYTDCRGPNLNGKFYAIAVHDGSSMNWDGYNSISSVRMSIKPKTEF